MSIRLRLTAIIVLLALVLGIGLYSNVQGSQQISDDAKQINGVGLLRSRSVQIESLARQIVAAEINNQNTVLAIEDRLDTELTLARSLVGLFNSSETVSREEFETFLQGSVANFPELRSIEYVPRVPANEREAFEQTIRDEGFESFQIVEPDASGELVAASEREEYFPVTYLVPFEPNRPSFGLDLLSTVRRRVALIEARDSGQVVATAPIALVQAEEGEQSAIHVFTPIYRVGADIETVEQRRENLQGFILQVVDIDALIENTVETLAQGAIVVSIADVTGGGDSTLYRNPAIDANDPDLLTTTLTLEVFGREWALVVVQLVDLADSLEQLSVFTNDLDRRVNALYAGSDEFQFSGLEPLDNDVIDEAYEILESQKDDLVNQILAFRTTSSVVSRNQQLTNIEATTASIFDQSDRLVRLLEDQADQHVENTEQTSLIVAIVAALAAAFGFWTIYQVVVSISRINTGAEALAEGNLGARVTATSGPEFGRIATSINLMAEQLEGLLTSFEQRIDESTGQLQTVVDLNQQIATILDFERLLLAVTSLTKDRFNLYHAHIYLLEGEELHLAAGAGYVGRQMVSRGQSIPINSTRSIVARAARSRDAVIVNNTNEAEDFLPNPLLPDTQSELAVPLISRGQLLGVLDVQSDEIEYFKEQTLEIMRVLAAQIANALANARLFEEATRISRREQALSQITQTMQTATSMDDVLQTAVRELGKALRVPRTAIEIDLGANDKGVNS